MCRVVALTHHEHWDGTGYPRQLAGTDIPLPGRMTAVADIFDALTSMRPYKQPWSVEQALAEITLQAGRHLDPVLATAFVELRSEIELIKSAYPDLNPA
jgi:putative two-component system response regulator